jgi:hypothetical protein
MEKFTLFLFFKSMVLFFAILLTISIIDRVIENFLRYNKLSSPDFEVEKSIKGALFIPISGTWVALMFWYAYYILSNL